MNTSEIKQIQQLREGTEAKSFQQKYQKLYILKRYLLKIKKKTRNYKYRR